MAKGKNVATMAEPPMKRASWLASQRLLWFGLALGVLIFYWTPLFDDQATIQWDTVDVHYSAQKYFKQSLRTTGLPHWTPFEYSGMPFLADPQTAAWYPLHWPFFLIGITPRALEWELALHAFLALGGAFLLARRLLHHTGAAAIAAVFYAFGGFFAGHSSHLGMFETALLLPWLLWAAVTAIETRNETAAMRARLGTGLIAGLIMLAGHFQSALYSFFGLAVLVALRGGPMLRRARALTSAGARVQILNYQDDFYRVRYSAPAECLLHIAIPFFPGWAAAIDGRVADVVPVDCALSGVFVPAGEHELTLQYRSRWFRLGAIVSLITAAACLGIIPRSLFTSRRGST